MLIFTDGREGTDLYASKTEIAQNRVHGKATPLGTIKQVYIEGHTAIRHTTQRLERGPKGA